jgi:hypothetical protein
VPPRRARRAPDRCAVDRLGLDIALALADALDRTAPDGGRVPNTVIVFDNRLAVRSRDDAFRTDHALRASGRRSHAVSAAPVDGRSLVVVGGTFEKR